jgi:hypothetical protein
MTRTLRNAVPFAVPFIEPFTVPPFLLSGMISPPLGRNPSRYMLDIVSQHVYNIQQVRGVPHLWQLSGLFPML